MTSDSPLARRRGFRALALTFLALPALLLWVILAAPGQATGQGAAPQENLSVYLPLLRTSEGPAPPPQFVKNVTIPDAQCPNAVGFNAISGYVYIANNFSYNVSVFKDASFVTNIPLGEWPTLIAADNDSSLTYVSVLHGQVTAIDGTAVVGTIPNHYEPYGVAVNPVNGYVYVTDLDSTVQVANGTSLIANIHVTDPERTPPFDGAGWLQPVVVDPNTGLTYVASWSHGKLYVLDGTSVVANYRAGWGVKDMAIDAMRGYIYLAHSEPNETYTNNISVFTINSQTITRIDTDSDHLDGSRAVAVDPTTGYAYFTNPDKDTVTVLLGAQVVATLPTGEMPWGVGVNPNTGYVFVTNRAGNSITVIKGLDVVNTIPAEGLQPFAVGVDTANNDVYIANRGDEYGLFQCRDASVTILR